MAQEKDCRCFKLRGKIFWRDYYCPENETDLNPSAWNYLGNSENFSITPNVTTETVPDYTNCTGGTLCKNTMIETVDVSFTTTCHSINNLGLAFNGEVVSDPGGPVVDEPHLLSDIDQDPCVIIPAGTIDATKPYTLTVNGTPLVEGTQFYIENGVIYLDKSENNGTYAAGDTLLLSYEAQPRQCVEGLLSPSRDIEFRFVGKNCDDNSPVDVHIYRACISASEEFTFISDTFNRITFNGVLLQDSSKKGDGISKYYKFAGVA